MAKVCISGYYGYDRVENELMLMSMVNALRRQDENMEIVVFSANVAQTEADYDVLAFGRDNWDDIRKELRGADLLIVGGGHLLKETADLADIKYYLKLMKMAQHMNVEVFFYHQILEPFANSRTKTMVGRVLQKVRKITVADQNSVEVLHEMGIRRGRIHLMADPVLALHDVSAVWSVSEAAAVEKKVAVKKEETEAPVKAEPINYDGMDVEIEIRIVEKEEPAVDPDKTIVIADLAETDLGEVSAEEAPAAEEEEVKPAKPVANRPENLANMVPSFWKKPGEKFAAFVVAPKTELPVTQITAMADHMVENGYQIVFLPLNIEEDVVLAKEIMGMMQHPSYIVDAKISAASLYTAIDAVDFVFSTELYPMMLAALCKKPFASLCCDERSLDFVSSLGLTPTGNLMDYNHEAFVYNFKAVVADSAAVLAAMEENLPALQEKAAYSEEQLVMLFEQIERKKTRNGKRRTPRKETPVVAEDLPLHETSAEESLEEDISEETVEVVTEESIEDLAEELMDAEDEAEEQGYVRRSRKGTGVNLDSVKDKAKNIFGGLGGKLKSLTAAKPSRSSRRNVEDEYYDDELALEEVVDEAEEKEVR